MQRSDGNFKVLQADQPDFERGVAYWDTIEASNNGVLGGFGNGPVPRIDALSSRMFLLTLKPSLSTIVPPHLQSLPKRTHPAKALDLGAGIGRVTSDVLLPLFDHVDLVESSSHFLEKAQKASARWRGIADSSKGLRFYKAGLQYFDPASPSGLFGKAGAEDLAEGYDVIWLQWVAGHLGQDDLVAFLQRCQKALRASPPEDRAVIVLKENVINTKEDAFDETDSSLVRTDESFKTCFNLAGLTLIQEEVQLGFPEELYPVKTYALY